MNAAEALRLAVVRLKAAGVGDPVRDARVLLAWALGIGADRLTLHLHDPMSDAATERFEGALQAREARRPVSQITGQRAFWGRSFAVTSDVLDPRPETETLIAEALSQPFTRVLDLGTGSGAILVTLLAECPQASGLGVDLSPAAITVAQRNAETQRLGPRATFKVSDWFEAVEGRFDLIVSNPPYITEDEFAQLSPEVRLHEPRLALTPGGDGLDAYRRIAAQAGAYLTKGARLMLEIGPAQGVAVRDLLERAGFAAVKILPDLDGRDRVVTAVWPG